VGHKILTQPINPIFSVFESESIEQSLWRWIVANAIGSLTAAYPVVVDN